MRAKILVLLFGMLLVISALTILDTFSASETRLYIDPPRVASVSWTPGSQFNITVKIVDVIDLFAWQFQLSWNETILKFIDVIEGPILATQPEGTFYAADTNQTAHPGSMGAVATTVGDYDGVDKALPEIIAYVTFEVKALGDSPLHLFDTLLVDSQFTGAPTPENEIAHTTTDGYFVNVGVPEAVFTYSPSYPVVNETVTFNASESYDTDGTIVAYRWDFGDGATVNETDPIATHNFTEVGSFVVNLTVEDDGGLANSKTSTLSIGYRHDVSVVSVSVDVYFIKSGQSLTITVTVMNEGAESEDFDVTVYHDDEAIDTKSVSNLAPGATKELEFVWDTTGVSAGDYTIKAVATLATDEAIGDNTKSGGEIEVEAGETSLPTMYLIGGAVAAVVAAGAIGLFLLRRRKGPGPEAASPP